MTPASRAGGALSEEEREALLAELPGGADEWRFLFAAVERVAQARYAEGQRDALAEAAEDHAAVDAHDRAVVAHLAEQWGDLRGRLAPHIALQDVKGAMTIVNRGDGR